MDRDSGYPLDWLRIGDKEILRARNLLKLDDLDGAAFNIQQAVEKYLKGFLLSRGWKLRRIHDLETLLNEAVAFESSLETFRSTCQKTTQYYIEERYPFTAGSSLTREEIEESLTAAEKLLQKIRALL